MWSVCGAYGQNQDCFTSCLLKLPVGCWQHAKEWLVPLRSYHEEKRRVTEVTAEVALSFEN